MRKEMPRKIHIIGPVGSGKTTLARQLSAKLSIPFYELDNVAWKRQVSGDIRRPEVDREACLDEIIQSNCWIVEGVHNEEWVFPSFNHAELIIFLNTNYNVRKYRIIKRFFLQKLRIEKSNYTPTVDIFIKMFKWNKYFEEITKPDFLSKKLYKEKVMMIEKQSELQKLLNEVL
ncbi:AAA family ATPase [Bacillus sp. CRN 9]|nr:AAA family ATPase [Bacillus sp. CRN 9]